MVRNVKRTEKKTHVKTCKDITEQNNTCKQYGPHKSQITHAMKKRGFNNLVYFHVDLIS